MQSLWLAWVPGGPGLAPALTPPFLAAPEPPTARSGPRAWLRDPCDGADGVAAVDRPCRTV